MNVFDLEQVRSAAEAAGRPYLEFLRVPDLSMGLYQLPAGGVDPQSPHTEDEVYYVVGGSARFRLAGEDHHVRAGSVLYVPKNVEHRFHDIDEHLTILVFFAPAEYSRRTD